MYYALLIHHAEEAWEQTSEPERQAAFAAHRKLQQDSKQQGAFRATARLAHSTAATTLRRRAGGEVLVDGPFLETKELLVGFYIFECQNLEEALEYARRIPTLGGGVEVRPIGFHDFAGA
jgi:hypothetical protein